MGSSEEIQREAQALSEYFLGRPATSQAIALYGEALSAQAFHWPKGEQKLWKLALSYPFLLPLIDAGLGARRMNTGVRKRVFLFFCIAEVIPEWSTFFLPQKKSPLKQYFLWLTFAVAALGIRLSAVF